jgi:hypothetical protein
MLRWRRKWMREREESLGTKTKKLCERDKCAIYILIVKS